MSAVFEAEGAQAADAYSRSGRWLEPEARGSAARSHVEDDAFYMLEGTMSGLLDGAWVG